MFRNYYNKKILIAVLLIITNLFSQDTYEELNKYLDEVDLTNSHRLLDMQIEAAEGYDKYEKVYNLKKLYKELYSENIKELMDDALSLIKNRSWWRFKADKNDTLKVIEKLEKIYQNYPEDYILNVVIGEKYFQIEDFHKAKPYLIKGATITPKYELYGHSISQASYHYLAALHFMINDIDEGFYFLEKSFIYGFSNMKHLETCPYLIILDEIDNKERYEKLLTDYRVKEIFDVRDFLQTIPAVKYPSILKTTKGPPIFANKIDKSVINKLDQWGTSFEKSGNLSHAHYCYERADFFRSILQKAKNPNSDLTYINHNVDKIISNLDRLGNYHRAALACFSYIFVLREMGNTDDSVLIKYYELGLLYSKKCGDRRKIAEISEYLGNIYAGFDKSKAVNYYNVSLYIHSENNDSLAIADAYIRFYLLGETKNIEYGTKAINIIRNNGESPFGPEEGTSESYKFRSLMGRLAYSHVKNMEYKKAIEYNEELLSWCWISDDCTANDTLNIAQNYVKILWEASDVISKDLLNEFLFGYEEVVEEYDEFFRIGGYYSLSAIYYSNFIYDQKKAEYYDKKLGLELENKDDDYFLKIRLEKIDALEKDNVDVERLNELFDGDIVDFGDLGIAWAYKNQPKKAKENFEQCINKFEKSGDLRTALDCYRGLVKLAVLEQNNEDLESYLSDALNIIEEKNSEDIRSEIESITLSDLSLPLKDRLIGWYDFSIKHDYITENYFDLFSTLRGYRAYWLKRNILNRSLQIGSLDEDEKAVYRPKKNQAFIGFDIIDESDGPKDFVIAESLLDLYKPENINNLYLENNLLSISFVDVNKMRKIDSVLNTIPNPSMTYMHNGKQYIVMPDDQAAADNKIWKEAWNSKVEEWGKFILIPTDSTFSEYNGIQNALKIYRKQLLTNDPNAKILASKFYDTLIKPIEHLISNYDDLIVIPDQNFTYLPFETLIDDKEKPLISNYTISYIQSQVLLEHMAHAGHDRKTYEYDLLAFGGAIYNVDKLAIFRPFYNSNNNNYKYADQIQDEQMREFIYRGNLPNLPASRTEVINISGLFDDSKVFTGKRVTEEVIKDLSGEGYLSKYKYIHFATHGKIDLDQPDMSAIVLSQDKSSTYNEDGFLTVREIGDLKLNGNIITLSACRTRTGKKFGTEGVIGLNEAFLSAGARGVCSTLWEIPDKPTSLFMQQLYERVSKGTDYRIALSQTKRDFLNGTFGKEYSHSSIWAPFVYYGM